MSRAPQPFEIHVPERVLDDLRLRLAQTRWPDEIPGVGWDYGANLAYVRELVAYWRDAFDWRKQERRLNERLPGFTASIDGLRIHFAHVRGRGPRPFPLLLIHGWPGSFFEMYKVAGPLSDPEAHGGDAADAFDLIIPSIPGHGFSQAPAKAGFGADRCADLFRTLMIDVLGYGRFGSQGGDRGAFVSVGLGQKYPEDVAGIHLNMATGIPGASSERTPEEARWLEEQAQWRRREAGYSEIQGTKPQTLSYGLNDSPTGLAAWIVEKWWAWSDCGGDIESRFTKDELLTNVMIYWVTGTIRSSTAFYYEHRRNPPLATRPGRVETPTGIAMFPKEVVRPPRSAAERKYNLQRWTEMASGGHFAAMEEPDALAEDIRAFFRPLRAR